jgi:hypothetical protein
MRLNTLASIVAFSVATILSPCARAQTGSVDTQTTIPFAFTVGKQLYPAGTYTITYLSTNAQVMNLFKDGKHLVSMHVMTRLARQAPVPKASLVFDLVGRQHFLSEVWLPEVDGYQVSTRANVHKHEAVEMAE